MKRVRKKEYENREAAQSLLEFIMLLPILIALVWFLLEIGMAINMSIVGQKHARSQVFLKMLNHRDGPVFGEYNNSPKSRSVFWLGVAAEATVEGNRFTAPITRLGVGLNPKDYPGTDDEKGEIQLGSLRQNIRVRSAFGLCTSRKPNADGGLGEFCGAVE